MKKLEDRSIEIICTTERKKIGGKKKNKAPGTYQRSNICLIRGLQRWKERVQSRKKHYLREETVLKAAQVQWNLYIQEAQKTFTKWTQSITHPDIIIKMWKTKSKEKSLKPETSHIQNKNLNNCGFLISTMKARNKWLNIYSMLKEPPSHISITKSQQDFL